MCVCVCVCVCVLCVCVCAASASLLQVGHVHGTMKSQFTATAGYKMAAWSSLMCGCRLSDCMLCLGAVMVWMAVLSLPWLPSTETSTPGSSVCVCVCVCACYVHFPALLPAYLGASGSKSKWLQCMCCCCCCGDCCTVVEGYCWALLEDVCF